MAFTRTPDKEGKVSYRLPAGYQMHKDTSELRNRMSNKLHDYKDTYNKEHEKDKRNIGTILDLECGIAEDTYRKYMGGKRQMSREFLAKFCIGLKMSLDEANELFELHSGRLNLTNDLDNIIYYAINDGDSVQSFMDELEETFNAPENKK